MKNSAKIFSICMIFCTLIAGAGEECPKGNIITQMSSSSDSFLAVQPLDFSEIRSAGAQISKDGDKLKVCLSNGDFTTSQMSNDFVVPITKKEEFIAVINFVNTGSKIEPGQYSASSGYGKPFWAFAEVKLQQGEKGVILSLGVKEGTAEIVQMTGDRICGTFNLSTTAGSNQPASISGTFSVPLETSRW